MAHFFVMGVHCHLNPRHFLPEYDLDRPKANCRLSDLRGDGPWGREAPSVPFD